MSSPFQPSAQGNRDALLTSLKRFAKQGKRAQTHQQLASFQDKIAIALGYTNWSMLHKHVTKMSEGQFDALSDKVHLHPQIGPFLDTKKGEQAINVKAAKEEMRDWVRCHFTPLIEFAFYDNESETGFAWPAADLSDELQGEFSDKYPLDLIIKVATDLEIEDGPWGVEEYGRDEK